MQRFLGCGGKCVGEFAYYYFHMNRINSREHLLMRITVLYISMTHIIFIGKFLKHQLYTFFVLTDMFKYFPRTFLHYCQSQKLVSQSPYDGFQLDIQFVTLRHATPRETLLDTQTHTHTHLDNHPKKHLRALLLFFRLEGAYIAYTMGRAVRATFQNVLSGYPCAIIRLLFVGAK